MQAREEITISAAGVDGNHATVVYPPRAATGTLETISFFQARYVFLSGSRTLFLSVHQTDPGKREKDLDVHSMRS